MIAGFVVALIATIGIGTGIALIRRTRARRNQKQDLISKRDNEQVLDKIYETLLESDFVEKNTSEPEKPKTVVVKLQNKSYWSVYGSLIISGLVISVFAIAMTVVSLSGQKAYSSRKAVEEQKKLLEQTKEADMQRDFESQQIIELCNRLDSIDIHVKSLKTAKPTLNKKKSQ